MDQPDLELEEGEIAEESNDEGGFDEEPAAAAPAATTEKKTPTTKKVVRKVKKKIKIKKKVVRKRNSANIVGTDASSNNANNVDDNSRPLLPQVQVQVQAQPQLQLLRQQQSQPQQPPPSTTSTLQPQLTTTSTTTTTTTQTPLQYVQNPQQPQTNNNNQLDSLWEQQIKMLQQAEQQQAQILRAAATDEDLRIFAPMLSHIPQSSAIPAMATVTAATTAPTMSMIHPSTHIPQPLPPTPLSMHNNNNQTPSSPDDENEKSSYEAISKMLTLLRNSANISDSSEMNTTEVDQQALSDQAQQATTIDAARQQATGGNAVVEYALVPILVEGIDYTKYKLLSQYEPKFKNDPRLYQQA